MKLEVMSTTVLTVPSVRSRCCEARERVVEEVAVDRVAEEQAGEEQHFRAEEQPHAQADGVVLDLDVVEVVGQVPAAGARWPLDAASLRAASSDGLATTWSDDHVLTSRPSSGSVWLFVDDRAAGEVVRRGGDAGPPLVAAGAPRVVAGDGPVLQGVGQVDGDDDEAERQQRGAGRRGHVQRLVELLVLEVAPRHAGVAQQELGDERGVEPQDDERRGHHAPALVVHAPEHLREPVVQRGQEAMITVRPP